MNFLYDKNINQSILCDFTGGKPDVRERAMKDGLDRLSNYELLMLLIGAGTKSRPVQVIAKDAMDSLNSLSEEPMFDRLMRVNGIGKTKAIAIAAALKLGERLNSSCGTKINNPDDLFPLVKNYSLERQEHFLSVLLNAVNEVQKIVLVGIGTINCAVIHPREVFAEAILQRCASIILCHNHPSGSLEPSHEDVSITERMCAVGKIVGIHVVDHLIIAQNGYFSFAASKLI